jgi:hypothetical protein
VKLSTLAVLALVLAAPAARAQTPEPAPAVPPVEAPATAPSEASAPAPVEAPAAAPVEAPAAAPAAAPVAAPAPAPVAYPNPEWKPAEAAAESAAAEPRREEGFVKGELSSLGATKLGTKNTRFGVRVGLSKIGEVFYLAGAGEFDLRVGKFLLGLSVPLQVPLYDPKLGLEGFLPEGLALRTEDYAIPQNYVRFVRFLRYGNKEDNLFVNIGTETSATIGHGNGVRRYVANVDVNQAKLSAEVDFYGKYGGAELFVGDVLSPFSMLAGVAFLKPFGASDKLALQRLSVGLTYAGDWNAPYKLARGPGNRQSLQYYTRLGTPVDGTAGVNPLPAVAETRQAHVVGLSVETKVVRTETSDLKPYFEFSKLMVGGGPEGEQLAGGWGASLGLLGRFTFGEHTKHALRLVGELRGFQGNFLPGYFDTVYGIQRYQYFTGKGDPTRDVTKLADVLGRDAALKLGYYAELQYSMVDWFALTVGWEDSQARGGRNLVLHAEVPMNKTLRFFASLHRRAVEGGLLEIGADPVSRQLQADNTLIISGARLRILPILYLNLRAFRMWQVDTMSQGYRNVDGFQADFEVGYEFARDEDEEDDKKDDKAEKKDEKK